MFYIYELDPPYITLRTLQFTIGITSLANLNTYNIELVFYFDIFPFMVHFDLNYPCIFYSFKFKFTSCITNVL